jgi:hypothetical protein
MRQAIKKRISERHCMDRIHTVCMLTVIQFLVLYGATAFMLSAVITTLIFIRDAGFTLFYDDFVRVDS